MRLRVRFASPWTVAVLALCSGACAERALPLPLAIGAVSPSDLSNPTFDLAVAGDLARDLAVTEDLARDLGLAMDLTARPDLPLPSGVNYMFVTSTTYVPGSLGGLSQADAACNTRARAAGLAGNYVAWLSTSTTSALSRLSGARGWYRTDGKPFGDTASSLITGQEMIFYPPRLDEFGVDFGASVQVATGTEYSGAATDLRFQCADWTSTSSLVIYGDGAGGAGRWTLQSSGACGDASHLYCFGIDFNVPLHLQKASGRIAFVTQKPFDPATGLGGADAFCATEAAASHLPGTYLALLSTTSSSAASRFDSSPASLPWVRSDGVPLVAAASDLFAGGPLLAPIDVAADGLYHKDDYRVWTGSTNPNLPGTLSDTCQNWSSHASSATARLGSSGLSAADYFADDQESCDFAAASIFCLQE